MLNILSGHHAHLVASANRGSNIDMGVLEPSARGGFLQIVSMSMRIICTFGISHS